MKKKSKPQKNDQEIWHVAMVEANPVVALCGTPQSEMARGGVPPTEGALPCPKCATLTVDELRSVARAYNLRSDLLRDELAKTEARDAALHHETRGLASIIFNAAREAALRKHTVSE